MVTIVLFTSLAFGCSSAQTGATSDGGAAAHDDADTAAAPPSADAAGGPATADSGADAGVDAGSDAQGGACVVNRVGKFTDCAEDCDARLTLPGGGVYCSIACAATKDCAALGSDLTCPETVGACVPRCTVTASCVASGFLRCDLQRGGCDTL